MKNIIVKHNDEMLKSLITKTAQLNNINIIDFDFTKLEEDKYALDSSMIIFDLNQLNEGYSILEKIKNENVICLFLGLNAIKNDIKYWISSGIKIKPETEMFAEKFLSNVRLQFLKTSSERIII